MTPAQKKFCYGHKAIARIWGTLGHQKRKIIGWCFETDTEKAFSDVTFARFHEYREKTDHDEGSEY